MNSLLLIPLLLLVQASYFDMHGTITDVIAPSAIIVNNTTIDLADVNSTGLTHNQYIRLMKDLDTKLLNKDVFIKGNYSYFDLIGSYNSVSINEMIQKMIDDLKDERRRYCDQYCQYLDE